MADTTLTGVLRNGTAASRPAANTVAKGTLYFATDTNVVSQSDGSSWTTIGTGGGVSDTGTVTYFDFTVGTAPSSPASGKLRLYALTGGHMYQKDSSGTATALDSAGGGSFSTYDTLISAMSSLVHRWKFEEASGNFADSVGSLTLTASGSFTYAVTGGPVSGASGSVTFGASGKGTSSGLGSIPTGAGARTFVLIYKGKNSSSKQTLFSYGTASSAAWWTAYLNDNEGLAPAFWSINAFGGTNDLALGAGGTNSAGAGGTHNAETWHMLACGYDGVGNLFAYLDGVFAGKQGASLSTGSSGNFTIGLDTGSSNQLGAVTFDDLAVFSRMLAPYELNQLFASLVGALP